MSGFRGAVRTPTDRSGAIRVTVDLTDERLSLRAGDTEIADWSLDEVKVNAHSDGFHIRAEGEEIILTVTEDAEFAVALGLNSAPIDLARRMSMVRDTKRTA